MTVYTPPPPTREAALSSLKALLSQRSLLPALQALRDETGDLFKLSFPGFQAVVMSGPEAAHFVYVTARHALRWRTETDPVTHLLRRGLLVEDGDSHDDLRRNLMPYFHRQKITSYLDKFIQRTDQVCETWQLSRPLDMLVEMRRVALLILMDALFEVDFTPDMHRLWDAILRNLKYISPGAWLLWRDIPRPGFQYALRELDEYLYGMIAAERQVKHPGDNLLKHLISAGMSDELIRDQVLTLFIAGHDTSTALLAWAIYLLAKHPQVIRRAQEEVDAILGDGPIVVDQVGRLVYLEQVINETLRIYPPIHLSNRFIAEELEFNGCRLPAGSRLMFSIYLTHHDKNHWPDPEHFDPQRFAPGVVHAPYTFIPFGGGPRNCIGAAFAQVEAKAVLARLLQRYNFTLIDPMVYMYMGATLEPKPGVMVQVSPRR